MLRKVGPQYQQPTPENLRQIKWGPGLIWGGVDLMCIKRTIQKQFNNAIKAVEEFGGPFRFLISSSYAGPSRHQIPRSTESARPFNLLCLLVTRRVNLGDIFLKYPAIISIYFNHVKLVLRFFPELGKKYSSCIFFVSFNINIYSKEKRCTPYQLPFFFSFYCNIFNNFKQANRNRSLCISWDSFSSFKKEMRQDLFAGIKAMEYFQTKFLGLIKKPKDPHIGSSNTTRLIYI
jgi:hypothetical protein